LAVSSVAHAQQPVPNNRNGSVRIVAIREDRLDLGGSFKVESFGLKAGHDDLAVLFSHGAAHGIPYGTYRAAVNVPGFRVPALAEVPINQREVLVMIDLRNTKAPPQIVSPSITHDF
jgi:hypothetical protein